MSKAKFKIEKVKFNGSSVKVKIPEPISWDEFVKDMRPFKKDLIKLNV